MRPTRTVSRGPGAEPSWPAARALGTRAESGCRASSSTATGSGRRTTGVRPPSRTGRRPRGSPRGSSLVTGSARYPSSPTHPSPRRAGADCATSRSSSCRTAALASTTRSLARTARTSCARSSSTDPRHAGRMTVYTHGHDEPVLRSHRWRTAANSCGYLLPHLRPEMTLLDVGCGPGTITNDLAALVSRVTAIEVSDSVIGPAREAVDRSNVEFVVADVHELGFDDATFDVVHAHQVLQHVADPVAALREMRRVCKPGGLVAARDGDYAGFVWAPQIAELTEWQVLYRRIARSNGGEPDAGRYLLGAARAAGFEEVTASSSTWCFATPEDRAWWAGSWAQRVTDSAPARQAVAGGFASPDDLRRIADGWQRWADSPDGWFSVLHGEILARALPAL